MRTVILLLLSAVLFAAPIGTDGASGSTSPSPGARESATQETEEEMEEFVPSEEISADRAISFPVDI